MDKNQDVQLTAEKRPGLPSDPPTRDQILAGVHDNDNFAKITCLSQMNSVSHGDVDSSAHSSARRLNVSNSSGFDQATDNLEILASISSHIDILPSAIHSLPSQSVHAVPNGAWNRNINITGMQRGLPIQKPHQFYHQLAPPIWLDPYSCANILAPYTQVVPQQSQTSIRRGGGNSCEPFFWQQHQCWQQHLPSHHQNFYQSNATARLPEANTDRRTPCAPAAPSIERPSAYRSGMMQKVTDLTFNEQTETYKAAKKSMQQDFKQGTRSTTGCHKRPLRKATKGCVVGRIRRFSSSINSYGDWEDIILGDFNSELNQKMTIQAGINMKYHHTIQLHRGGQLKFFGNLLYGKKRDDLAHAMLHRKKTLSLYRQYSFGPGNIYPEPRVHVILSSRGTEWGRSESSSKTSSHVAQHYNSSCVPRDSESSDDKTARCEEHSSRDYIARDNVSSIARKDSTSSQGRHHGYVYHGVKMRALPIKLVPEVSCIASELAKLYGLPNQEWNIGVNMIVYRDGNDRMGWHADDTQGETLVLCVVVESENARPIKIRPKAKNGKLNDGDEEIELLVSQGDAYQMDGDMQEGYEHCLPPQRGLSTRRAVMIFRQGDVVSIDDDSGTALIEQTRPTLLNLCEGDSHPNTDMLAPLQKIPSVRFGRLDFYLVEGKEFYSRGYLSSTRAHRTDQRGVNGSIILGCDSIIVSRQNCMLREDDGLKWIKYTSSRKQGGGALCRSFLEQLPVRVFRSSNLKNRYAPPVRDRTHSAYRYDGLYEVIEMWDKYGRPTKKYPSTGGEQHTFLLKRCPKKTGFGFNASAPPTNYDRFNYLGVQELWNEIQKSYGVEVCLSFIPTAPKTDLCFLPNDMPPNKGTASRNKQLTKPHVPPRDTKSGSSKISVDKSPSRTSGHINGMTFNHSTNAHEAQVPSRHVLPCSVSELESNSLDCVADETAQRLPQVSIKESIETTLTEDRDAVLVSQVHSKEETGESLKNISFSNRIEFEKAPDVCVDHKTMESSSGGSSSQSPKKKAKSSASQIEMKVTNKARLSNAGDDQRASNSEPTNPKCMDYQAKSKKTTCNSEKFVGPVHKKCTAVKTVDCMDAHDGDTVTTPTRRPKGRESPHKQLWRDDGNSTDKLFIITYKPQDFLKAQWYVVQVDTNATKKCQVLKNGTYYLQFWTLTCYQDSSTTADQARWVPDIHIVSIKGRICDRIEINPKNAEKEARRADRFWFALRLNLDKHLVTGPFDFCKEKGESTYTIAGDVWEHAAKKLREMHCEDGPCVLPQAGHCDMQSSNVPIISTVSGKGSDEACNSILSENQSLDVSQNKSPVLKQGSCTGSVGSESVPKGAKSNGDVGRRNQTRKRRHGVGRTCLEKSATGREIGPKPPKRGKRNNSPQLKLWKEIEQSTDKLFLIQYQSPAEDTPEWHVVQVDKKLTQRRHVMRNGKYHLRFWARDYLQDSGVCADRAIWFPNIYFVSTAGNLTHRIQVHPNKAEKEASKKAQFWYTLELPLDEHLITGPFNFSRINEQPTYCIPLEVWRRAVPKLKEAKCMKGPCALPDCFI